MAKPNDDDLDALRTLSQLLSGFLASIERDQWTLATPCDDWDLAELVDHVTGGNWFTSRILAGHSADQAMQETILLFGDGSASGEQAVGSVDEQLGAFAQAGALDRICHHVVGDITGHEVIRLRLHDLIVHTWDIAQTLNPPAALPDNLVRWAVAELSDDESQTAKHFGLTDIPTFDIQDTDKITATYLECFGR